MNFASIFLLFAALYLAALGGYYFNDKFKNKKLRSNKIITKKETAMQKNEPNEPREVDIAGSLLFLTSSLNEDAQKNKNYVLLDYDIAYPRLFYADIATLTKLIDAMAQIFLLNVSDSTVTIKFLLSNYYKNNIKFTLSVYCDRDFFANKNILQVNMNAKSRKFYEIAKTLAEQNGSQIIFEFDPGARASTEISMTLSDNKFDLMQNLKIKNPKNFSVLVAEPNPNAFFVLRKNLEFIGIDVKPSSEWSIVKRHIEDMIFRPGAVFIEENLLGEIDDALTALLIEKKIALVVLKNTNAAINLNPKIRIWTLPQPYLPDSLVRILNEAYAFGAQNNWQP